MPKSQYKQYIGDAVYADFDGYHIVLTTENGIETTNRICLEPSVFDSLKKYEQWVLQTLYLNKQNEPTGTETS